MPSWAVETTLVPSDSFLLADQTLADDLRVMMRAIAIEHGARGLVTAIDTTGTRK